MELIIEASVRLATAWTAMDEHKATGAFAGGAAVPLTALGHSQSLRGRWRSVLCIVLWFSL